jgi:hypothetical protein
MKQKKRRLKRDGNGHWLIIFSYFLEDRQAACCCDDDVLVHVEAKCTLEARREASG